MSNNKQVNDVASAFGDLIFKICLMENSDLVKQAVNKCLSNHVADVNRLRFEKALNLLVKVTQDVITTSPEQVQHDVQILPDPNSLRQENTTSIPPVSSSKEDMKINCSIINPKFVQITADKSEIDRRMAAFIERQRVKVNITNIQEFCGVELDQENSCARVNAVFQPRAGSKSHIVVKRAVNEFGPQTRSDRCIEWNSNSAPELPSDNSASITAPSNKRQALSDGTEERLRNMESHLRMYSGGTPVPKDVYTRLQQLEERILYLESLSPEYLQNTSRHLSYFSKEKCF